MGSKKSKNGIFFEATEAAALKLFDEIYAELIDDRKQPPDEIIKEVTQWQPPDCGPLSAD